MWNNRNAETTRSDEREKRGAWSENASRFQATTECVDHPTFFREVTQQWIDINRAQIVPSVQKKKHVRYFKDGASGRIQKICKVDVRRAPRAFCNIVGNAQDGRRSCSAKRKNFRSSSCSASEKSWALKSAPLRQISIFSKRNWPSSICRCPARSSLLLLLSYPSAPSHFGVYDRTLLKITDAFARQARRSA